MELRMSSTCHCPPKKSKKEKKLHVPLDFKNAIRTIALHDSGAYLSAIGQNKLITIKKQAPAKIFEIDDPPNFQFQVANGQLEKPSATATLKFDFGDHIFGQYFVVMKYLTGPIIGLHFMRHNSVSIDSTHGLIHFPQLTMLDKSAASGVNANPKLSSLTTPEKNHKW